MIYLAAWYTAVVDRLSHVGIYEEKQKSGEIEALRSPFRKRLAGIQKPASPQRARSSSSESIC